MPCGTGGCALGPRNPPAAVVPNAAARGAGSWAAAVMIGQRADAVGEAMTHVQEAVSVSVAGGLGAKNAVVRARR
eukprot:172789-Chlamydomonas_euryale.AAC.1